MHNARRLYHNMKNCLLEDLRSREEFPMVWDCNINVRITVITLSMRKCRSAHVKFTNSTEIALYQIQTVANRDNCPPLTVRICEEFNHWESKEPK